ncbi:mandelate racemase/muconate lactonizing enzyme family protein [Vulcanisaeta thermophila]|uniref:mandelate racemase/muconate lactonizing enzyme family protein n=1 Tax=Vulcanisaeta thermophila TaxID=867917 RepID=UPI00085296CC|nr:mandelate racemase/muconate lactonizing enzyme family protein [Vulcanisaeta thermophila]
MPRLVDIGVFPASIPYDDDPPTVFRDSWGVQLYVKVDLGGYVGWGEVLVYGSGVVDAYIGVINDVIKPALVGSSIEAVGDIGGVVKRLEKLLFTAGLCGVVMGAVGGVEMALWDAYAKYVGKPLASLLGGPVRYEVPVYASFPRYSRIDYVVKAVDKALSRGFTMVKLHEHPDQVPEALKAIRDSQGYDVKVAVDVNAPFERPEDALEFIGRIHRYEPAWVEEPTWPPYDYEKLSTIAQKSPIPVAAGENEYTLTGFRALASTGVAYVQPDISKVGGVLKMMEITNELARMGKPVAPHHRPHRSILAHTYTLHIASLSNEIVTVEWPLAPWPQDLINVDLPIRNGMISIAGLMRGSGVGVSINQELLGSRYNYRGGYRPLVFH